MCGRYLTPDDAAFERHWGLQAPAGYHRSYNVAPSRPAPVVRVRSNGELAAELAVWGFRPAWAKRAWINARAETVFTSTAFTQAARERRCLVPALGWYEWQGEKAPKQPFLQYRTGLRPISFAGIWTSAPTPDGRARSFAILTRPATPALARIHDRMPVVLDPADYTAWLDRRTSADRAGSILRADGPEIVAYPISTYVNKPEHDDVRCIQPLTSEGDAPPA